MPHLEPTSNLLDCMLLSRGRASSAREAATLAVEALGERRALGAVDRAALIDELAREADLHRSRVGAGAAVLLSHSSAVSAPSVVLLRLESALAPRSPEELPLRLVAAVIAPAARPEVSVALLAELAALLSDGELNERLFEARDLVALRAARAPKPASTASSRPRYGLRPFAGVAGDVARRWPHYGTDLRDGLHPKVIGATLFLFFACIAPAVAFGGMIARLTGGSMGAVEMIVATAACGIVYSLLAGQPLVILGATGPLVIFTGVVYDASQRLSLPFLPTYAWVGLWTAAFTALFAIFNASSLLRFFTRFTDEIFGALISVIFIYEALVFVFAAFPAPHIADDAALLGLVLAIGTFSLGRSLASLRRTPYLRQGARAFFADFGPAIAILLATLAAHYFTNVEQSWLPVPTTVATSTGRAWRVNLGEAPRWVWLAAAIPGFFGSILVYLDQNITARLVNAPAHRLRGDGYHLDLAVVAVLLGVCSLFGLPWLVAATVRSLNHVKSLAEFETSSSGTERIASVRENRVSGLAIHALVAGALLALPLLRHVPMAALYGLFLYMGVASLGGNELIERVRLWITDPAAYPPTHYVRTVPSSAIHRFTLLQVACLALLWFVKASALAMLFPLFIALLVPIRLVAGRFFEPRHMAALDRLDDAEDPHGDLGP